MAYYKVPQDVEADDKLIGPFTFKQFIFLIGFALSGFITFSLGQVSFFLALPLLPVVLFFALLGFYRPKDQPIENKLLAYVNFYFKPHTRVWSRDGIVEHVHIRAPKVVEKYVSDKRSQTQVRSQLQQLAQIVDTRGWSTKRSELQEPTSFSVSDNSDRLVSPAELSRYNQDAIDIHESDDVFEDENPVTESFSHLSQEVTQRARQEAFARMEAARTPTPTTQQPAPDQTASPTPAPQPQPASPMPAQTNVIQPQITDEERKYTSEPTIGTPASSRPHFDPFPHMHQRVLDPNGNNTSANTATDPTPQPAPPNPEYEQRIKELASSDLPVSSLAERAKENNNDEQVLNISH